MNVEEKDYEDYLQAIRRIDLLLQRPIETLADLLADRLAPPGEAPRRGAPNTAEVIALPPRLVEGLGDATGANLNNALCCSTLQRVWLQRRRFPGLASKLDQVQRQLLETLGSEHTLPECLAEPFLAAARSAESFDELAKLYANPSGSALDPTTAAQILWILINAGERKAQSAAGFVALFFVLWALYRKLPQAGGVAAGNSPPTAYLTAKCLSPLFRLMALFRRRAEILERIAKQVKGLDGNERSSKTTLPMHLDELASQLQELAAIAMSRDGFTRCAKAIDHIADHADAATSSKEIVDQVSGALLEALEAVGELGRQCLDDARRPVAELIPGFLRSLGQEEDGLSQTLDFKSPQFRDDRRRREYERDLVGAAKLARRACREAFQTLNQVTRRCSGMGRAQPGKLAEIFSFLAEANRKIALLIEPATTDAVNWCHEVLTRQVAHASAKNLTEFDPAELLGALFVTVAGRRLESTLPVQDAIEKALAGLRDDGSWLPGQPFLVQHYLGAWAPTSDLIWLLTSTLDRLPTIRTADAALRMFIDWLDRTQRRIKYQMDDSTGAPRYLLACGWISERDLLPEGIDLWATAYAVNALLGIRELMEYRLWELCEKRFTVLTPDRRLSVIDAVDLGVGHAHRLHRHLARMMRQATGDDYKHAEYSLILHGPPGSSKTAIAGALASEMWRSADGSGKLRGRLIRVTPADFTRLGESRLDSEARTIFDLLRNIRGATVLFDEIDDLLRRRESKQGVAFLDLVVPAMLNRLQDLRDACPAQELCFVLATNYVDRMEPALIRKGRIDKALALVYPDQESRKWILERHVDELRKKRAPAATWAADFLKAASDSLLRDTRRWPWKTFDAFCTAAGRALEGVNGVPARKRKRAAEERIADELRHARSGVPERIYTKKRLITKSPELRDEMIEYCLSGAAGTVEAVGKLVELARGDDGISPGNGEGLAQVADAKIVLVNRAASAVLAATFGPGVDEAISAKARMRNWQRVRLDGEPSAG